jgi:hypothetical protein
MAKKRRVKRVLIVRGGKSYYVYRDLKTGRFKGPWVRKGRSLAADRRKKAKRKVPPGYGDRGDQK